MSYLLLQEDFLRPKADFLLIFLVALQWMVGERLYEPFLSIVCCLKYEGDSEYTEPGGLARVAGSRNDPPSPVPGVPGGGTTTLGVMGRGPCSVPVSPRGSWAPVAWLRFVGMKFIHKFCNSKEKGSPSEHASLPSAQKGAAEGRQCPL